MVLNEHVVSFSCFAFNSLRKSAGYISLIVLLLLFCVISLGCHGLVWSFSIVSFSFFNLYTVKPVLSGQSKDIN